jgi:hypothetical protein
MMDGVAFILLKAGRRWPESAKQAEIRLAILLKIVKIAGFLGQKPLQSVGRTCAGCTGAGFRGYG